MPKLIGNTILAHSETGEPVVLLAGEDVPEWAEGLIGEHLIEGADEEPEGGEAPKGNASREDWAAYAASKGAPEDETRPVEEGGLKQTELRDKYGK